MHLKHVHEERAGTGGGCAGASAGARLSSTHASIPSSPHVAASSAFAQHDACTVDYGSSVAHNLLSGGNTSISNRNRSSSNAIANDFCRLYIRLHCDHGGGNVSAHTSHLVGSAGANPFACFAAAFVALEAPLHGGASGNALQWMHDMQNSISVTAPGTSVNAAAVTEYALQVLQGRSKTAKSTVIPGFGHAALAAPDPRALALLKFARSHAVLQQHRSVQLAVVAIPGGM